VRGVGCLHKRGGGGVGMQDKWEPGKPFARGRVRRASASTGRCFLIGGNRISVPQFSGR